ncbi:MAG: hypothetical protein ACLVB1_10405 [Blautia obeum]
MKSSAKLSCRPEIIHLRNFAYVQQYLSICRGATITKTSPRKEILLRLGDTQKSAGGYEGYRNITIDGGTWDSNYECVEDKEDLEVCRF